MVNNIDYVALGSRIRAARLTKGITQRELAKLSKITPSYISSIEKGTSMIALPTLVAIASILETTIDTLLFDSTPALVAKYDEDARLILKDCSNDERQFLLDLMKHAKADLRKNLKTGGNIYEKH